MRTILAATLVFACAAPARAQKADALDAALVEVDVRLSRAASQLEALEALVARRLKTGADPVAACAANFSLEDVMRGLAAGSYAGADRTLVGTPYLEALMEWALYKAVKEGPAACAPLRVFTLVIDKKPSSHELTCRRIALSRATTMAFVQGNAPEAARRCREALPILDPYFPAEQAGAFCAAVVAGGGRAEAVCPKHGHIFKDPQAQVECQKLLAQYHTTEANCLKLFPDQEDRFVKTQCLGTAGYIKAWKAKDAKLCGGAVGCWTLMGNPAPLRAEEKKLAPLFCSELKNAAYERYGVHALVDDADNRGSVIMGLLQDAKARLLDADGALPLPDAGAIKKIDSRLEKALLLKARCEKTLTALHTAAK